MARHADKRKSGKGRNLLTEGHIKKPRGEGFVEGRFACRHYAVVLYK